MSLRIALQNKDVNEIRRIANGLPIADLADLLESLTAQDRVLFFRLLKTEEQSEIFAQLEPTYQEQLVASFTDSQIDEIIGDLYADEIADLIEEVPHELQKRIILSISDKETRANVNKILKFEDDQTGSVMNVDMVVLDESMTPTQALNKIKKSRDDYRLEHFFFVVDKHSKLLGYVALEDLVWAGPRTKVKTLVKPTGSVLTTTPVEETANEFAKYDMSVLPVVSATGEVVGMITADEVLDIAIEEATEDAHLSAGITPTDRPYSETSVWRLFRSRSLWLMLLMISSTISQIVITQFMNLASSTIDHVSAATAAVTLSSAIVAIGPVISGAAGNAGSQSSAMVIRALATGDITTKDYLKVFKKELGTSMIVGMALAVANFVRLMIYYAATGDISNSTFIWLSFAASIALFIVIALAYIVGGLLPLLAKKLKMDPAVMAAPLLTTLIDAISTMTLFGVSIGIIMIVL